MEDKVEEIFQKIKKMEIEEDEENWRTSSGGPISKKKFQKDRDNGK